MAVWYSNLVVDRKDLPALAPNLISQCSVTICAVLSVVWEPLQFVFGLALLSAVAFAQSCIVIGSLPVCFELTTVVVDLARIESALRSETAIAVAQFGQKSETRHGFEIGEFPLAFWVIVAAIVLVILLVIAHGYVSALGFAEQM